MRSHRIDIHVNQHVDAKNRREGRADPCITVKQGRTNRYAAEVEILDYAGAVVARVCYRPEAPLPHNGARCWIEVTGVAPLRLLRGGLVVAELPAAPAVAHVSKQAIRDNGAAQGAPILTVWQGGRALEADVVELLGQGAILATIVYQPAQPLPCGAKCWVRTWSTNVRLIGEVVSPGRRVTPRSTA